MMFGTVRVALLACAFVTFFTTVAEAGSFVWRWQNRSGHTIHVELYSKTRNHVWPGHGKAWIVPPNYVSYSNSISCYHGEKICYGAWWASKQNVYWGAGRGGVRACVNCCYTCNGLQSHVIPFDPPH